MVHLINILWVLSDALFGAVFGFILHFKAGTGNTDPDPDTM